MKQVTKLYESPSTVRASVALEESMCAAGSLVIKENVSDNAEVTISEQEKGADGVEFEFDTF